VVREGILTLRGREEGGERIVTLRGHEEGGESMGGRSFPEGLLVERAVILFSTEFALRGEQSSL
jgi:hypothetical protein